MENLNVAPAHVPARSRLAEKLEAGKFVITAEITPPASSDIEDLLEKALPLRDVADAVNVTDGAGARVHLDAPIAAMTLLQNGIEPILQMTCRDRNRIALQSALLGAAALGIQNVLMLRGDDPSKGDQPEAKPVFDLDSVGLVRTAVAIRDRSELPNGRKLRGRSDFFVGVGDTPVDPPPGWLPKGLQAKVAAGAQFIQTQFCMDPEVVARYARCLADAGVTKRAFLLIGVAPLASARSARWIRDHLYGSIIPESIIDRMDAAADPKAEGRRICVELLEELAEIPGVAGAHVMAPLNESAIVDVIREARRSGVRNAAAR